MTTRADLDQMGEERDRLPMGMPSLPGEKVIFETRGWFAPWLWIIYLIIPAFIVWWVRRHRHLVVTTRRVIYTEGVINKSQRVINLQRVQDVGVYQGFFARIFGYGDLLTESAGETGHESIKYLSHVRGARDAILVAVHHGEEDLDTQGM
jgi:uncharacterized membrane protein YdbT with pleckstrin-like domain